MKNYFKPIIHKSPTFKENPKVDSGVSRRAFLGFTTAGIALATLSACGGPEIVKNLNSRPLEDINFDGVKPASKIKFWSTHPGKSIEVEKQLIQEFHKQYPEIEVELVTAGADYEEGVQKFQTAQAGGEIPALITLSDVWWFRCLLNNSIIPLDNVMKEAKNNVSDYVNSFYSDYEYSKLHWAVPYARSTPLFYYNKNVWKSVGLPDRAPKSWEEFLDWGPKIQKEIGSSKTAFQHPAPIDYATWVWQNNLWGNDTGWSNKWDITSNSPKTIETIQMLQDTINKWKWAGVASLDSGTDFSSELAACTVASTGSMKSIVDVAKFDIGVGFVPQGPNNQDNVCPTGGAGLCIPRKQSKESQLAAAIFSSFITNAQSSVTFSSATGYLPTRKSINPSSLYKSLPLIKTSLEQLSHTRTQDYARVFIPGGDRILTQACAKILNEKADPQKTLDKATEEVKSLFETEVKPYVKLF